MDSAHAVIVWNRAQSRRSYAQGRFWRRGLYRHLKGMVTPLPTHREGVRATPGHAASPFAAHRAVQCLTSFERLNGLGDCVLNGESSIRCENSDIRQTAA